jgi:chaperonin cofactor prefoldin
MSDTSKTPRTNAVWRELPDDYETSLHKLKEHARTLELELAAEREARVKLDEAFSELSEWAQDCEFIHKTDNGDLVFSKSGELLLSQSFDAAMTQLQRKE